MIKTIILDRDGVINEDSDAYIKSLEEFNPIPGSYEAIAQLYKAGFQIFVVTNQSGIGRRYYTIKTLHDMHKKMLAGITEQGGEIEKIYFCPHTPDDNCHCRKPKTGMFNQLAEENNVDLKNTIMVGDAARDIESARAVGCKNIYLVKTGKGEQTINSDINLDGIVICDDLADAVKLIIEFDFSGMV